MTSLSGQSAQEEKIVRRDELPEALANTMDHIIGQLDIISKTMSLLDHRLTMVEDRVTSVIAQTRGIVKVRPETVSRLESDDVEFEDCGQVDHSSDEDSIEFEAGRENA